LRDHTKHGLKKFRARGKELTSMGDNLIGFPGYLDLGKG
jgi:hypothetical protein